MKSLSLSKPHVLVMIGAPGVGKTFFAEQFAETFKAPLVSHARICRQLEVSPAGTNDELERINRVADGQLHELLKTQRSIIVDGSGQTRAERVTLGAKTRREGYELLYVWVQTDPATAKHRATKATRTRSHDELMTEAQYEARLRQFSPPNAIEKPIVISGKHTYATQVKVVLKRLVEPRVQQMDATPPSPSSTAAGNRRIVIR